MWYLCVWCVCVVVCFSSSHPHFSPHLTFPSSHPHLNKCFGFIVLFLMLYSPLSLHSLLFPNPLHICLPSPLCGGKVELQEGEEDVIVTEEVGIEERKPGPFLVKEGEQ